MDDIDVRIPVYSGFMVSHPPVERWGSYAGRDADNRMVPFSRQTLDFSGEFLPDSLFLEFGVYKESKEDIFFEADGTDYFVFYASDEDIPFDRVL